MKAAVVMFMLLGATWGWKAYIPGKPGQIRPEFLTEFVEWIDYDNPPPSNYSLKVMREAELFYGVGMNDVDWTGDRYYINGSTMDYYDYMWNQINVQAKDEVEWYPDVAVDGEWGQWTPISHCLFLGNDTSRIEELNIEEDRGVNEFNGGAEQDYKKWLGMWSDAEHWLGMDTFQVPEGWPTVDELARRNKEENGTWVAQLRVRFCNDPVPLNGGKLCRGDNGVFERKVFYFQQPKTPEQYYRRKLLEKHNLTEYDGGNWCTPSSVNFFHDVRQKDWRYIEQRSILRHNGPPEIVDEIEQLKVEYNRRKKKMEKINKKKIQNRRTFVKDLNEAWEKHFKLVGSENYTSDIWAEKKRLYKIFEENRDKLVARNKKNWDLKQETNKQLDQLDKKRDEDIEVVKKNMEKIRKGNLWKEIGRTYYDLPF